MLKVEIEKALLRFEQRSNAKELYKQDSLTVVPEGKRKKKTGEGTYRRRWLW